VYWSSCAVPFVVVRFERIFSSIDRFSKSTEISNYHENPSSERRVVPCGRTDMTKLMVIFRNFANALKILGQYS